MQSAIALGVLDAIFKFGITIHMAPRALRTYGFVPGFVMAPHGIIAGCTQRTTLAKILLHQILHSI